MWPVTVSPVAQSYIVDYMRLASFRDPGGPFSLTSSDEVYLSGSSSGIHVEYLPSFLRGLRGRSLYSLVFLLAVFCVRVDQFGESAGFFHVFGQFEGGYAFPFILG